MCGRGEVDYSTEKVREAFAHLDELDVQIDLSSPRLNVSPTDPVPVVHREDGRLLLSDIRWGGKRRVPGRPFHLVKSESVANGSLASRSRGLVVFSKVYEWQGELGKNRTPFAARAANGDVLALAALCGRSVSSDGEVTESCTILTQPPLGLLVAIHDRMPVFVDRSDFGAWLEASGKTAAVLDVVRARQAALADMLEVYQEDPYVLANGHPPAQARKPVQGSLF